MSRTFFCCGIMIVLAGLPLPEATGATERIIDGPAVERVNSNSAIINWTIRNPGGTDLHYAVARYGTNSRSLVETARSPNRRNKGHADMTFRVILRGLKPGTTYYYRVESEQATGSADGPRSAVKLFTTPQAR